MTDIKEVKVPDIGDFKDVDVIEVLISAGDEVSVDDPLITLESDKATMDVPAPYAGVVKEVKVSAGDKVSEGSMILEMELQTEGAKTRKTAPPESTEQAQAPEPEPEVAAGREDISPDEADISAEVVVLGSGPGGYTAAFRAADLGKKTVLVERYPTLGGVCLNVGCIPSKALLHAADVVAEVEEMSKHGLEFGNPRFDAQKLSKWKDGIVGRLTRGLAGLAKKRTVQVVQGVGKFLSPHALLVEHNKETVTIHFEHAIIAAGSQSARIPGLPDDDDRIWDSTAALALSLIPERMLVIGGGIIGLEMATVFDALGTRITVAELSDKLIPGCDDDLVKPLQKRITRRYENIFLNTGVTHIEPRKEGLGITFDGKNAPDSDLFDNILVAVGRTPNGNRIGAEAAGIRVDQRGFIAVDRQQRTNVPHIFAIGDIVGQPMLAHKATHEGKVAAEVAAGMKSSFDARAIPAVAYTNPEVAWMGLSEREVKEQGLAYEKGVFPWAASGRSLGMVRDEGLTKLLFDKETRRLMGAGIVGPRAGDLISEVVLALEMGADAQDIGLSIHPHPTLSETVYFAAEMVEGTITDLYAPRK
jgi:dihydrolipoamide dehydrogenase